MLKKKQMTWLNISATIIFILLLIITVCGIFSFSIDNKYEAINLYGQVIEMYGTGIYQYDSYFKAPILIGSDLAMLLIVVPVIGSYIFRDIITVEQKTNFLSILGIILYYAFSISFGVAHNQLQLVYILLTSISFFTLFTLLMDIYGISLCYNCSFHLRKIEFVFLILAGASNIIVWLPDVLHSLFTGSTLERIEMYTTEITYVLDMGIISPLVFIIIYLLIKKKSYISLVLYRMILVTLKVIGVMLPIQTIVQLRAGIYIPIPELVTKVAIFVTLAIISIYFDKLNKKRITVILSNNNF
ncbi:hypothetical protein ACTPEW_13045 [Clostridioides difficile]